MLSAKTLRSLIVYLRFFSGVDQPQVSSFQPLVPKKKRECPRLMANPTGAVMP